MSIVTKEKGDGTMSKKIKIVVIGGGSSYTPEIIEGFLNRYYKLPVSDLWLVDIESGREKLSIIASLAKRMVEKAGVEMNIHTSLDRKEALLGADFVVTQIRVGQLDARIRDERIPLSHGLLGQETNGAGGLFKAFRTIPVLLQICDEIKQLCPDAWLINFTNPVGIVTEALHRYGSHKKVIGLCNIAIGMTKSIEEILDCKSKDVNVTFAGINHMVYANHVFLDGKEVTDQVLEKWGNQTVKNISSREWDNGFLKALGAIPCSYHRYYFMADEYLEEDLEDYAKNGTRAEKVKQIEKELFEVYKDQALDVKPKQLELRGGAQYSDAACNLICSLYNDTKDIQVVNTINHGSLSFLGYEDVVETSCVITKEGPIPLTGCDLPKEAQGIVLLLKSFEVAAVEAAISGDYNKALLAMMINPLVGSQRKAKLVLDEMLESNKEYLPQFFKKER